MTCLMLVGLELRDRLDFIFSICQTFIQYTMTLANARVIFVFFFLHTVLFIEYLQSVSSSVSLIIQSGVFYFY